MSYLGIGFDGLILWAIIRDNGHDRCCIDINSLKTTAGGNT